MSKIKGLLDHVSKSQTQKQAETAFGAEINAVNVILFEPTHSSVNTATTTLHNDPIKASIVEHDKLPIHHPPQHVGRRNERARGSTTNLPMCLNWKNSRNTTSTHTSSVVAVNTDKGTTRNQMLRYMREFPLGVVQPELSDTIHYKNANVMSKVIAAENTNRADGDPD